MTTLNLQVNASGNDGSIDNTALSPQLTANLVNIGNVNGNSSSTAGFRFTSATVPQGATITSATLTLYGYSSYSTGSTISAIAACEDVDNSSAFTTSSGDFNTTNRPRTTATSASKDIKSVTAGVAYTWDISTSVQEVVDRAGWSSGNAISVFVDNDGSASNEWQDFEAYDHNSTLAAKLDITYTTGGGSQGITADLLTNTSEIPTHTVANAAPSQDITANLLTNTSEFFSPSVEYAPTYINSSNTTGSTASTSTTISVPSGVATGDLMIATVVVELASASITPSESGWTLLSNTPLSTRTHTQNVYARLASVSEPGTYTWTHSSAERVGAMIVFRNAQFPTLYNAQANNTSSANCAAPSLTLDRANSTSLWIGTNMYGTTWTAPTNYTERLDYRTGTGTSNISISFATRSGLATGATGTITGTSANADYSVGAHVAFGPAVSVLPASLENTSVIYSATISQGAAPQELLPSILTNSNTFYSPTITTGSVDISITTLVNSSIIEQPLISTGSVFISPNVLENTNTLYDADFSTGSVDIVANSIENTSSVYEPSFSVGAVTIYLESVTSSIVVYEPQLTQNTVASILENTSIIYEPEITLGQVEVVLDLITNTSVIYQPVVGTGYTIVPELLENSSVIQQPQVTTGSVAIATNLLENSSTVEEPALSYEVSADLFENSSTVHQPTIEAQAVTISLNVLENTSEIFEVFIGSGVTIQPTLIGSSNVVEQPLITVGVVSISVNTIDSVEEVYEPSLIQEQFVSPDVIINSSELYSVSVTSGGTTIQPELLSNTNSVYDIIVSVDAVTISPDSIDSINSFGDIEVTTTNSVVVNSLENNSVVEEPKLVAIVSTQLINNTNSFTSVLVTTGAVNIETVSVDSSTVVHPPQVFIGDSITITPILLQNTNIFYNALLNSFYGRINRVLGSGRLSSIYNTIRTDYIPRTSRTNEVGSTVREYDVLNN